MVKAPKKSRREPANKEHLAQVAEAVQRRNLEIVRRQNRNYARQKQHAAAGSSRKRSRSSEGDESESDQIVRKCFEEWLEEEDLTEPKVNNNDDDGEDNKVAEESYKKWRRDEYDKYNAINRKTLLSKIDMFEKMMKPAKKVDCGSKSRDGNKIMWTSPTYIAQYIRKCILKREWTELAHLLLLLTKHSQLYESYTREMAFLTALMSTDKRDKDLPAHLELCFVTERAQGAKEFDVWYVEKSANETEDSC